MTSVEITTNGATVWINGPDGMCIGRYKPGMMDVHRDSAAQLRGEPQCLDCSHGDVGWSDFTAAMSVHHGVVVPDKFRPASEHGAADGGGA